MRKLWPLYLRVSRPQKERQRCNWVLNWSAVIVAKLQLQKSGPGWLHLNARYSKMGCTEQNCAGQSSRAINISNGRLLILCLYSEMTSFRKCGLPLEIKNLNAVHWTTVETDLALLAASLPMRKNPWKAKRNMALYRVCWKAEELVNRRDLTSSCRAGREIGRRMSLWRLRFTAVNSLRMRNEFVGSEKPFNLWT